MNNPVDRGRKLNVHKTFRRRQDGEAESDRFDEGTFSIAQVDDAHNY